MTFEIVQRIKESIEAFPKTKLYSVVDDKRLMVQNEETGAIYEIGYADEDGVYLFDTSEMIMIEGPTAIPTILDEVRGNVKKLHDGIHRIFSEDVLDTAIADLKHIIITLPSVDKRALNEALDTEAKQNNETPIVESVSELGEKFGKQMKVYVEEKKEFEKTMNLFGEDNELNSGKFYEKSEVNKSLVAMSELHEQFKADAGKFAESKEKIINLFEDNTELSTKFFESLDVTKNVKVGVTKRLVELAQTHKDLNIKELAPKIVSIFENQIMNVEGTPLPAIYNLATDNKYRPKFFRFQMGIFSPEDVKVMINELNDHLSRLGNYDDEEMMYMADCKMKLEYMYNAQQMNDHLIAEMIEGFNKKFAKDQSAAYSDPSKQLAWKDREQQRENLPKGMAQ